jgi:predicted AAA+ superfamily ATPase
VAGRTRLILDEAQSFPAVFPRLRGAIDADRRRNGRFLLLGSASPALMRSVGESLAGRMAVAPQRPPRSYSPLQ